MIWGGGLPGKVRLVILWVSTGSPDSYPVTLLSSGPCPQCPRPPSFPLDQAADVGGPGLSRAPPLVLGVQDTRSGAMAMVMCEVMETAVLCEGPNSHPPVSSLCSFGDEPSSSLMSA